jgi:uncharacterized membrane protein (GlpM family)
VPLERDPAFALSAALQVALFAVAISTTHYRMSGMGPLVPAQNVIV